MGGRPPPDPEAERNYGASARPDPSVVYQPDVVLLAGGATSVRSVSSDGLVWTIDAADPNAGNLAPGRVMLASSLGAGRILSVDDVDGARRVVLGPIALTDLLHDADLSFDGPIADDAALVYTLPDAPGQQGEPDPADPTETTTPGATPAAPGTPGRSLTAPRRGTLAPPSPTMPNLNVGGWKSTPICCTSNGVHLSYSSGGARLSATAQYTLNSPALSFHLRIGGGQVLDAGLKLTGGASLSIAVKASITASSDNASSGPVRLPASISIPIPVAGVPLTISFEQSFDVRMGLSGTASLETEGEWQLGGALGFEITGGSVRGELPTLTTTKSALDNITSYAVAPQGLSIAMAVKAMIGVGVPGLSAGVWYQVSAGLSMATSGANLPGLGSTSLVPCKTLALSIQGRYGVGYRIPEFVAKAVNAVLSLLVKQPPQIPATAGPSWGPTTLFNQSTPPCTRL